MPKLGGPTALGQTTAAQPFGLQVAPPDPTPPTVAGVLTKKRACAAGVSAPPIRIPF